jgi:hypothetical protein
MTPDSYTYPLLDFFSTAIVLGDNTELSESATEKTKLFRADVRSWQENHERFFANSRMIKGLRMPLRIMSCSTATHFALETTLFKRLIT